MSKLSNETIIERYLKHFNSIESKKMRKSSLKYFFSEDHFNYSEHIFNLNTRILMDYFDYLNRLETISLTTKKNKWHILTSFLQYIMEYYNSIGTKFIVIIPQKTINWAVRHKKAISNKNVIATIPEIKRILNHLKKGNRKHYVIFRLLTETGIRKGELLSANINSVDIEQQFINGIGKKGEKIYFFSKELGKHLKQYLIMRRTIESKYDNLFLSQLKKPYTNRSFNEILTYNLKKLNITKRITCHTFRRTLNTLRKHNGCPNEDRKILIGHKVQDINVSAYTILDYKDLLNLSNKYNPYKNTQL